MEVAPRCILFTKFMLFKLLYTAHTVAVMPVYCQLLGKVRTLLESAGEPLRKKWQCME